MQDSHWLDNETLVLGTKGDVVLKRTAAGVMKITDGSNTPGNLVSATKEVDGANGEQWILGSSTELLTLSTDGLTTDTAANLLPANSIIEAVVCRITTTITTTTDWAVGDATIAARFSAAEATLTAGTTSVGLQQSDQTGTSGPKQTAAAKVRITCTVANPGAGAIRITVFYRKFTPPTA